MIKLPPGKYYIGDPCLVFNEDTWRRLASEIDFNGDIITVGSYSVWGCTTADGDGVFQDQNENEFCVDSGVLAAIPIELVDNPAGQDKGVVIDASKGLIVEYDNGTFWFGGLCIHTDVTDSESDFAVDEFDGGYDGDLSSEFLD